jgi:hypothetical protein
MHVDAKRNRVISTVILYGLLLGWLGLSSHNMLTRIWREHWRNVLGANPIDVQTSAGTTFAQYMYRLQRSIDPHASVAIITTQPTQDMAFARFYADYWNYPRTTIVTRSINDATMTRPSVLVLISTPGERSQLTEQIALGYDLLSVAPFEAQYEVAQWRRR